MITLPSPVPGVSIQIDLSSRTWLVSSATCSCTLRSWTWGERRQILRAASPAGTLDSRLLADAVLDLLVQPPPDESSRVGIAAACVVQLGVHGRTELPSLARSELLLARMLGWRPHELETEDVAVLDEIVAQLDEIGTGAAVAPSRARGMSTAAREATGARPERPSAPFAPDPGAGWTQIVFENTSLPVPRADHAAHGAQREAHRPIEPEPAEGRRRPQPASPDAEMAEPRIRDGADEVPGSPRTEHRWTELPRTEAPRTAPMEGPSSPPPEHRAFSWGIVPPATARLHPRRDAAQHARRAPTLPTSDERREPARPQVTEPDVRRAIVRVRWPDEPGQPESVPVRVVTPVAQAPAADARRQPEEPLLPANPFAASELEEAIADALERAARESGLDLT